MPKIQDSDIFTRQVIEETFQQYLDELGINTVLSIEDNIITSSKEKLLLSFLRDFNTFKIDFDLLISLIGMIWIIDPEKFDPLKQTKIELLCFKSLELQWAMRNNPSKYVEKLEDLHEYYEKNKKKLK